MKRVLTPVLLLLFIVPSTPLFAQPLSPVSPLQDAVLPDTVWAFSWNSFPGATNYRLQIDTDPLFGTPELEATTTQLGANIDSLLFGKLYYWRIQADTGAGFNVNSYKRYFRTFSPKLLPNLSLWLRADGNVTKDASNKVSAWTSTHAVNNVSFTQPTASKQPTWVPNVLNGKPALQFDGVNDFLNAGDTLDLKQYSRTIFLLGKSNVSASSNYLAKALAANATNRFSIGYNGSSILVYSHHDVSSKLISASTTYNSYLIHNIRVSRPSGLAQFYLNNNIAGSVTGISGTSYNFNSTYRFLIGAYNNSSDNGEVSFLNGVINEIIIADVALTDSFRLITSAYLNSKYNQSFLLPPDTTISYGFCNFKINATPGFNSYSWNTGATSDSITVTSSGYYICSATDRFGFVHTDSILVEYSTIPAVISDTSICQGQVVSWHTGLDSNLYQFAWSDNSTGPGIQVTQAGSYSVTITDTNGCQFISPAVNIIVDTFAQTVSLGPDTSFCAGNYIGLVSGNANTQSYLWKGGGTDSVLIVNNSGDYWLEATNANGCKAYDTIHVAISGVAPVVNIVSDTVCLGDSTHFLDLSSVQPPSQVVQWKWFFGDGDSSAQQNPVHYYSNPGAYPVQLSVVSDSGCSNTGFYTAILHPVGSASFYTEPVDTGCIANGLVFYNTTNIPAGDSVQWWLWNFGDNSTSGLENPNHTYQSGGQFTVQLTAHTWHGCEVSYQQTKTILTQFAHPENFYLISPQHGTIGPANPGNYTWNYSPNTYRYRFELSVTPVFASIVHQQVTSNTSMAFASSLSTGQYFWRVIAYNLCGDSVVSNTHRFEIFSPAQVSGLALWLDPASYITKNGTGNISAWKNRADTGIVFQQPSTAKQPIFNLNGLNNRPVVKFDGTNDVLNAGDTLDLNYRSRVLIVIGKSDTNLQGAFLAKAKAANATNRFSLHYSNGNLGFLFHDNTNNKIDALANSRRYKYLRTQSNRMGQLMSLYEDNLLRGSISGITTNTYKFNSSYRILIGAYNDANDISEISYLKGEIAEILMYDTLLTAEQQYKVDKYLQTKYSPPVNLGPDIRVAYGFCDTTLSAGNYIKYQWNTGDTTASIQANKPGIYAVTVTDLFGFTSWDSVRLWHKGRFLRDTMICAGEVVTWNTNLPKATYNFLWQDNSTDSVLQITQTGTYNVEITDTNGCLIRDSIFVFVDPYPVTATLGPDTGICLGESIGLSAGAAQTVSYLWSTADTTDQIMVSTTGNYWLEATDSLGCKAFDTILVTIKGQSPSPDFTFNMQCLGDSMVFTDASIAATGDTLAQWFWNFGDSTFSALQDPKHVYADTGKYMVNLLVSTTDGCTNDYTDQVEVYPLPEAKFTVSKACEKNETFFTDQSTVVGAVIIGWQWDFGDTTFSTTKNPSHTYSKPGMYIVSLEVMASTGCRHTKTDTVYVLPSPVADFAYDSTCVGNPTVFTDLSDDSQSAPIINWNWDFGNSTSSSQQHPLRTYNTAGTYQVTLLVTATSGCYGTITQAVHVSEMPSADFRQDTLCVGIPHTFTDQSVAQGTVINIWEWDFGDGNSATGQFPTHTYLDTGNYLVKLRITNDIGCIDSIVLPVRVVGLPVAAFNFNPDFGPAPITIVFDNQSTGAVAYDWYVDGNYTSSATSPGYDFNQNGWYYVTLIAFNANGCSDTVTDSIQIVEPVLDIAVDELIVTQDIQNDGTYRIALAAKLVNTGTRKIHNVDLFAGVGTGTQIIETWEGELQSGASIIYNFKSVFFLADLQGQSFACLEARNPNGEEDDYPDDNLKCELLADEIKVLNPFPNPADQEVILQVVLPKDGQIVVEEYNALGDKTRVIHNDMGTRGINRWHINTANTPVGTYFLRVAFRKENFVKVYIVQH